MWLHLCMALFLFVWLELQLPNPHDLSLHQFRMAPSRRHENDSSTGSTTTTVQTARLWYYDRPATPVTVAYVVLVTECNAYSLDAALALKHSIVQQQQRSSPRYNSTLYALVHTSSLYCAEPFRTAGFDHVFARGNVVEKWQLPTSHLRGKLPVQEFMWLWGYGLDQHDIAVQLSVNSVVTQPLDSLFDAMLYHPSSSIGTVARSKLLSRGLVHTLPVDTIDTFVTRTESVVDRGLLIVRPNREVLDVLTDVLLTGDFDTNLGWGGQGKYLDMGVGGFLGYIYDHILYDTTVELSTEYFCSQRDCGHMTVSNLHTI